MSLTHASSTVPSSFHLAFDDQAQRTPEAVAIVGRPGAEASYKRYSLTYAEVCARSWVLAAGLVQRLEPLASGSTGGPPEVSHIVSERPVLAVHLPRSHPDFVPLMVAASRIGVPFVLLSTDLPDRTLESQRAEITFRVLKPRLCVTHEAADVGALVALSGRCVVVGIQDLVVHPDAQTMIEMPTCEILCFMFTGGTQRTKVVEATHAMVLHERRTYKELWRPRSSCRAVVLAHTSAYWGASALGQLSIAFAFGGTTVFTEIADTIELRQCIGEEAVNVIGVVPDHLDLLAPSDPTNELPSVEVVFTWGEKLPRRVSDRWRANHRAVVRELLIATEYWLSFWADPLGDGQLRIVSGTDVAILTEDGRFAEVGELGELSLSGPMVMAGYRSCEPGVPPPDPFYKAPCGRRFFKTSDLVRRTENGFVYKGRADMMAKDKGKWVDMMAVEDAVSRLSGIVGAKIVPDPRQEHYHLFVALEASMSPGPVLDTVRAVLPSRVQIWQVPELPRHPVTRKVNTTRLLKMLSSAPRSWPVEGGVPPWDDEPLAKQRLDLKFWRQAAHTLGAVGVAWSVSGDHKDLARQAVLAGAALAGAPLLLGRKRDVRQARAAAGMVASWFVLAVVASFPVGRHRIGRWLLSLLQLTYGWLALTHLDDARQNGSRMATALMSLIDEIPLWKFGAFLWLSVLQHLHGIAGTLSRATLYGATIAGGILASRRRRLLAWPIVFWAGAIGHQLEVDCSRWWQTHAWVNHLSWQASRLHTLFSSVFYRQSVASISREVSDGGSDPSGSDSAPPELLCAKCAAKFEARYPARDKQRQPLCADCGSAWVAEYEATALEFLAECNAQVLSNIPVKPLGPPQYKDAKNGSCLALEPVAKRQRTEPEAGALVMEVDDGAGVERAADPPEPSVEVLRHWWWYHKMSDLIDFSEDELAQSDVLCARRPQGFQAAPELLSPHGALVCAIVGEVEPLLKPVQLGTILLGLDSLRVARLSNAIRARMNRALTAPQLREAKTVAQLVEILEAAKEQPAAATTETSSVVVPEDHSREYAVWFSPGQYSPMGHWLMRSDQPLDEAALISATQQLVERHPGMRAKVVDPVRLNSFMFDAAVLFSLYASMLDAGPWFTRSLRRVVSWALTKCWPRIRCSSREDMYGKEFPGIAVPFSKVVVSGGQIDFERTLKQRRQDLQPPGDFSYYELPAYLVDVWAFERCRARVAVVRRPEGIAAAAGTAAEGAEFFYVDLDNFEWGPLVGPGSRHWQRPPWGFPALFCAPLSSGNAVWLRLEKADELRVCYVISGEPLIHLTAYRAAPQRPREVHAPIVVRFVGFAMWHSFADGHCALPIVQDFCSFYEAELGKAGSVRPPPLENPFAELERRLFDNFMNRPSPMRHSLRGSLWKHHGRGFGHTIGLEPGAMAALITASTCYRVPRDVAMLGLLACAQARADNSEMLEYTLYAPMRDGIADAMAVGLFADWRDLSIGVDLELATILGTVLQLSYKIQHRQWTVYNCLRKPERTVVNIQPLDFEQRAGFTNLQENMWYGGDQLGRECRRGDDLGQVHQPMNFTIEQHDEDKWWILVGCAVEKRKEPWMRAFVHAFREALAAFLFDPLKRVHTPLPSDVEILSGFKDAAAFDGHY